MWCSQKSQASCNVLASWRSYGLCRIVIFIEIQLLEYYDNPEVGEVVYSVDVVVISPTVTSKNKQSNEQDYCN